METGKRFFRITDVLNEFGISRGTLWSWTRRGLFPKGRKIDNEGRLLFWTHEDIETVRERLFSR